MARIPGGPGTNFITGLWEGDDSQRGMGNHRWLAQTFTITEKKHCWRFPIKAWRTGNGAFWNASIRGTTPAGAPSNVVYGYSTQTSKRDDHYAPGRWFRFDFTPDIILEPGKYTFILACWGAIQDDLHHWRCDETAPPYTGGDAWISNDWGSTWTPIPGIDFLFEVWGHDPPADPPDITIPAEWAPVEEEESPWANTVTIVVTTDCLCHLYMRWTLEPPLKHKISRVVRGITLSTETRYCFVAFHENEQIEPGDTLIHTFVKPNWPICETRYFYFIGTKHRETSPSASPIFTYHHEKIEFPSQLLTPDGDGALTQLISTDDPHYLSILHNDSLYLPPNGGGTFGWLTGHYIRKNWFPSGYHTDLYTFTQPFWNDLPIAYLVVHYRLGRDTYPWGNWHSVLRVTGTNYQGDVQTFPIGLEWRHYTWYTNPATGNPWTHDEVAALEAGIAMNKVGSFGNTWCDAIHIELRY